MVLAKKCQSTKGGSVCKVFYLNELPSNHPSIITKFINLSMFFSCLKSDLTASRCRTREVASEIMSQSANKESKARSIFKGLTWRVLATATTFLLAWLFAKDLSVATTIATVEFFIKFAIYYAHERAWQLVPRRSFQKASTEINQQEVSV